MKHTQLILAAALVALAGCSKENIDLTGQNSLDNEIGFTAVTKKATKANDAIISSTTYATDNTFNVWGWQSEKSGNEAFSDLTNNPASNFMSGLEISYCGGPSNRSNAWRNANHYYYWPYTGTIGFLAIHPSTVTPDANSVKWNTSNKKPEAAISDYTIGASNITTDLMFAYNYGSKQSEPLNLVFQHALSQIVVIVKTQEDYSNDVKFDINSVEFNNIDLSGDLVYDWVITPAQGETPASENFRFTWTDNTNASQIQSWLYYNTTKEDVVLTPAQYGNPILMIPQPANKKDATANPVDNTETTLTISYSMQQKPLDANAKITGTVVVAAPWLTADATPANIAGWEPGKKYVYTLNFKLDEITFNPQVANWVEVDVQTINIPE